MRSVDEEEGLLGSLDRNLASDVSAICYGHPQGMKLAMRLVDYKLYVRGVATATNCVWR